ncbi:hypothetical protein [Streptomyces sp. NBC_01262]|uniref:hypothetical protein n=1 Tax=Streptomyces sp. NBC_01262 TaxID=2903803 RepID=UPI002E377565|nr:hypothetical protein [Streptomyces sp. NBC_01262]
MLKKTLAVAALAVAGAGAAMAMAPAAMASDTSGGDYSQNVNVLPHLCVDAKNIANGIGLIGAQVPIANSFEGQQCNEKSKINGDHKGPLSDFADIGAYQH